MRSASRRANTDLGIGKEARKRKRAFLDKKRMASFTDNIHGNCETETDSERDDRRRTTTLPVFWKGTHGGVERHANFYVKK